jgi:hypothetical protein
MNIQSCKPPGYQSQAPNPFQRTNQFYGAQGGSINLPANFGGFVPTDDSLEKFERLGVLLKKKLGPGERFRTE